MNFIKTLSIITAATIILSACGNKPAQTKKYYRLSPSAAVTASETKPATLVVKRPKALSILGGRPIVATKEDGSLVQLSHHFWLESPKVLLQDKLKVWASEHWQSVSYQVPNDNTHHILDSRILAFEKRQKLAVVSLEFSLYDHENKLLFNQTYDNEQAIEGEGFKAFTTALSRSVDAILIQLTADL
ncbi:ABC-type transport auxiliary lipoprotein family protein [Marinicella sp. S1101]|uniref:ABC-type transport auxiliary lipoprotein family protein n=1 Tax=Marinicella marina TaxID=2996016 RepID=UPI002260BBF2|nr:ABC-type transport auxiliary lipoprotein family protein [Marinicella marina]MCX7552610.1 ABC-type transport auxiliary lipoprotein family protein [Marinicella marina]MDJ1139486.1 ABC-type transport auxiliary lipoprotein family protein [Marinicella marina]